MTSYISSLLAMFAIQFAAYRNTGDPVLSIVVGLGFFCGLTAIIRAIKDTSPVSEKNGEKPQKQPVVP